MFKILKRRELNPTVTYLEVMAPAIAEKAEAGQFLILRVDGEGERVPFTVCGIDKVRGTVEIVFQIVGASTERLNRLREGEAIHDLVGPLGNPTVLEGSRVCLIGGGVGSAIVLPVARHFKSKGLVIHSIIGYQTKALAIFEEEFRAVSDEIVIMTDDGSYGRKGLVTEGL
ncbi:MAG: sulfide/dihydroorotate dehydrogenase-like FAD/NAD-binding protein, partial [Deltaproteobacteria bacterium]|nr:sulfide/dihydroorotate dehydrogenase-like FAD/NAD-binding protein [Deltaproteobacteria bacterium]